MSAGIELGDSAGVEVEPSAEAASDHEGKARHAFAIQVGRHLVERGDWDEAIYIAGSHPLEGQGATRRVASRIWLIGARQSPASGGASRLVVEGRRWSKASTTELTSSPLKFSEALATRAVGQNLMIVHFSRHGQHARGRALWLHRPELEACDGAKHLDDARWVHAAARKAGLALP